MKRFVAILLVIAMLLTGTISLAGCGATTADTALSMGQWVALIADSFGMQNYFSDTPYFKNINKDNDYFAAFQMAAEWDIIEPSEEIRDTTAVKYKDALVSLVNAGNFMQEDSAEEDKIDYALNNFATTIRKYWLNRYIRMDQAIELLDKAQKLWAEKPIADPIHEAKFANGVKDYLHDDLQYTEENKKIKIESSKIGQIANGDIFALPCSGGNAAMIKKASNVTYEGEYAYIEYEDVSDDELTKYAEDIVVRDSTEVDFSNIVGIYDESGNPIVFDEASDQSGDIESNTVSYIAESKDAKAQAVQLGKLNDPGAQAEKTGIFDNAKGEYTFNVKGNKITLSLTGKGFGIKWSKDSNKKSNQYRDTKKTTSVGVTCDYIRLDKDIDIKWGKIKSALLKIDYKTTIQGGVKITTNNKVGQQDGDGSNVSSTLNGIIDGYKNAIQNITKGVNETKYTNDSVYICRIKLVPAGLAAVDFIVKGVVTVTGEVKLVVEIQGCQGLEYKNGKVRYINSKGVDTDFAAEGKVETTISPGFAITILDRWTLGEILVNIGAGVSVSYRAHLFDDEKHHIYTESGVTLSAEDIEELEAVEKTVSAEELEAFAKSKGGTYDAKDDASVNILRGFCLEWKLYPIIRLSLGDGLLPNLLRSAKVSLSYEFLGESSNRFTLTGHVDFSAQRQPATYLMEILDSESFGDLKSNLGIGQKCTFDFKPWDDSKSELPIGDEKAQIDQSDILTTEKITISTIRLTLLAGETGEVSITGLPKGYTLEDIIAESGDKKIATIDTAHGIVKAHEKTGTTVITIKTKDGKYQTDLAVTVVGEDNVKFTGISAVLVGVGKEV